MSTKPLSELAKKFPLRRIKTDEELDIASEIFSELGMKDKLSSAESNYLEVLEILIMDYEAKSPRIQAMLAEARAIPPQRILQSILEESGMSQSQLAREIGCHQENISAFLAGKRGLSKVNAVKLAKYFCLSADFFLPRINEKLAG